MNSVVNGVILIMALAQAAMLIFAVVRGTRLKTGRLWLPGLLVVQIVTTISFLFAIDASIASVPRLLSTLLLVGLMTAYASVVFLDILPAYVRWPLILGGVWLAVVLIASVVSGEPASSSGGIVEAVLSLSLLEMALTVGFAVMSVALLAGVFYAFYTSRLPEVSNRALFWVFDSTLVFTGFVLSVSGSTVLVVVGLALLTLGMFIVTYAQVTVRVFDIRNLFGIMFRLVLMTTITALAIFASLAIITTLEIANPTEQAILAGVLALTVAIIYAPVRELGDYIITRLLVGERADAIGVTKRYSQELARAIEINELVQIATKTLNSVLRVRSSGMLLVSESGESGIELTLMNAGTSAGPHGRRVKIPAEGPFYQQVVVKQLPITQFDIISSPFYKNIQPEVRAFFQAMDMSAYAPIVMDGATTGLLASGAKLNDTPMYQRDLELLVALANQTGVALRNTRLVADLRHLNNSMQMLNRSLGMANDRMGQLDSVKTDFVTIASHELRTPLAQIRGYTDIVDALNDQGMLDQDQTRGLVNNLRKATERMEELIAAMLDVSQLDVNAMDLRFTQTSPESVLRMAIEPLTDPIKQRKLTLSARGLRGLPPVEADMQRLVQAFRNLITNAIKYTPDGGRIDISAKHHPANGEGEPEYILISITDTGIGIDQEHQTLIFNKFYRVSDPGLHSTGTYKFLGAGPGLGLTIAKGVVDGHGGQIWADSPGYNPELMPGSTFYVKLPLTPPENASRVLPFESEKSSSGSDVRKTQPMKVLQ